MLAKGGQIIADDAEHFLHFSASDSYIYKDTKKPVHNCLIYDYDDGKQHYRITYIRKSDLSNKGKMGEITGIKRLLMRLMGLGGAYIRFSGEATVDRFEGDTMVESVSAIAIWELMCIGKTPPEAVMRWRMMAQQRTQHTAATTNLPTKAPGATS